jgi:hypothetical protein
VEDDEPWLRQKENGWHDECKSLPGEQYRKVGSRKRGQEGERASTHLYPTTKQGLRGGGISEEGCDRVDDACKVEASIDDGLTLEVGGRIQAVRGSRVAELGKKLQPHH